MATTRRLRRAGRTERLRAGFRAGLRAAAVLLVGLTVAACDLTLSEPIEPEDVMVVEAYLRPDVVQQEVFVYRTLPGQDGSLRVDGAVVRISGPGGLRTEPVPTTAELGITTAAGACAQSSILAEGTAGTCYVANFIGLRPGGTYTLEVTAPDGRRLTGRTTVPGTFEVLNPAVDTCSLESGGFEVVWSAADSAWSYQATARLTGLAAGLTALGVENPPDTLDLTGLAIGRADTTIAFPMEFGVFDRFTLDRDLALALQQGLPTGASADIVVAAGDRNFVNWVRGGNFNPSGQVRVPSVTGDGTGVFGSLVTRRLTVLSQTSGYPICQ